MLIQNHFSYLGLVTPVKSYPTFSKNIFEIFFLAKISKIQKIQYFLTGVSNQYEILHIYVKFAAESNEILAAP